MASSSLGIASLQVSRLIGRPSAASSFSWWAAAPFVEAARTSRHVWADGCRCSIRFGHTLMAHAKEESGWALETMPTLQLSPRDLRTCHAGFGLDSSRPEF
jgi:hypothetical protein